MTWIVRHAATSVDLAAAALFAGAMAFCASALGSGSLAMALAPLAFFLACAGLAQVGEARVFRLGDFAPGTIGAPEFGADARQDDDKIVRLFEPRQLAIARPCKSADGGGDARQALSDAFAELSRSLR